MKNRINVGALTLAVLFFFDSTAYGLKAILFNESITPRIEMRHGNSGSINLDQNDSSNAHVVLTEPLAPDGGPDQPEVKSFTPIGTSDMVDPFSGDFSYNIPLLDIDGYPINIAYHSGITMDQEATWVGLGWNLNPGVVSRMMRGIPDEFNGKDIIEKEYNVKPNWTIGGTVGADVELFGFGELPGGQAVGASLNASLGVNYNNYNGFGSTFSFGAGAQFGGSTSNDYGLMSAGLGFSGSSTGGATISPSLGLNLTGKDGHTVNSINIASPINSRTGLERMTMSYTRTKDVSKNVMIFMVPVAKVRESYSRLSISSSYNFGMSTFIPQISMPMNSGGGTFSLKLGSDIVGFDGSLSFSGSYNRQWLKSTDQDVGAYGYMNLAKGQLNDRAMMDFNRENDGPFTKNTPALPIPNVTYDIFSASGQGVAGSYRPVRRDIGYVFDPAVKNNSVNGSFGLELGLGATFKSGIDVQATYSNSNSGPYNGSENGMASVLKYSDDNFYFREANELAVDADPDHFTKIGGNLPLHFDVKNQRKINPKLMINKNNEFASYSNYSKSGEDRRNQVVYTLSNEEMNNDLGVQAIHPNAFGKDNDYINHHIGQFTVLNVEGSRYVYGIAAYSHSQQNVSFAVGDTRKTSFPNEPICDQGYINYSPNVDNSLDNKWGVDNHYNSVKTPPFAHSYLLTSVLNADYVDVDNVKGPSKGDLGGYIIFGYKKVYDYKWRTPVAENIASYDEGKNTDVYDDKGHYIYGEKELWYVSEIKSKNHIAVFYTSPREDGWSVVGENGGLMLDTSLNMRRLDSIELFSLPDYETGNAVPLKTVHFEYEYSLCKGYPQHSEFDGVQNGTGKLTLKKIYFTYQGSHKGRYSPYSFTYGSNVDDNPDYNAKSSDRWNCFKPQTNCSNNQLQGDLKPSDYPYVGYDKSNVDKWSAVWNITQIDLPSGGYIEIDYESDDYAYVQHRKAQNMLRIIGVHGYDENNSIDIHESGLVSVSSIFNENAFIYVEMIPGITDVSKYVQPGQEIYFRALMQYSDNTFDFVPGYAIVDDMDYPPAYVVLPSGDKAIRIRLKGARLADNGNFDYNPIAIAGIQYGRLHLSNFIPPSTGFSMDESANLPSLGQSIAGAFASFQEIFEGPNALLWEAQVGTKLVIDKSWVRLTNPDSKKLGGGCRVKEIRMHDAFNEMTGMPGYHYGQTYEYTLADGTSSGVASYEPQLGGDENPWKTPVTNNKSNLLAPDIRNYQETPFGEQFFPSARVGYSRVTIKDLPRTGVSRTATGKVVHEFYTAKDFPTIVKQTDVDYKRLKIPIFALFFNSMIDEMAASQGFVVENNDMHGKPKSQSVYAEGQTEPITIVSFNYESEPMVFDGVPAYHLKNNVATIDKNGQVGQSTIGLNYEAFADFRESKSNNISGSIDYNFNAVLPFLYVPTIMGSGSYERTAFRSATFTKVIERFGLQTQTIAEDLGSRVETNNLAYDAETGTVLLTQTTTDFNDKVYNFTYPAHWYYGQMGQAYKNVGKTALDLNFVNGGVGLTNNDRFTRGDEVAVLYPNDSYDLAWVTDATPNGIQVLLKDGTPLSGPVKHLKVLRSGRKNMQTTPVGTIALRSNPLDQLQGNVFEQVLQAGAVEYSDDWRTFCECFLDQEDAHYTTNPYVLGTRGTWRPQASYVHLSDRTQSLENGNSNIREDGMFTTFSPFYQLNGGNWSIDKENWTYTSSVVEFSPFGQALETVDALNRYSSSIFGFNQTLPLAVAANTRYKQLGYDGFEDYGYDNCSDNHFRIGEGATIVDIESHTGRNSIKVSAGSPVVFSNVFSEECEDEPCMKINTTLSTTSCPRCEGDQEHIVAAIITPSGGSAPYQYEYEILNGNPIVTINPDNLSITNLLNEHISIKITITDTNGCVEIIVL